MRAEFAVATAVRRPRVRRALAALAALAVSVLAACAPGATMQRSAAAGGEVALAPAPATSGASTYAPITLAELASPGALVRGAALAAPARPAPLAMPALGPHGAASAGVELWRGTYVARTYGRRGALALALRPSPSGVRGTVAWRVAVARDQALGRANGDSVALVRVPVVAATRDTGQLVLYLDSYFDPACGCTARATFRGAVRGDTLVGRFSIEGAPTVVGEKRGHWRAVRVVH